ncbi:FtsX-like permease family protein [Komarekiella sp. 'clone 1']|uniref:FtsX-like permease family protein n=1 Tax=Komarekiella delphini-convector SJRDD-AB1 TaxID=2593771 RepID=A0AA40T350_9NOST|nr:ABC transporter permease DevC [Komarekiella delphini-convector]MBD6619779.1 FtsX-like permease family protein [Komarekiella delphini-convector SJRDD-AB1]
MTFKTPLAWLQLTKERGRFLSALVGIAFADMLMFMQLGFQLAGYYSQSAMHRHLKADLVLISSKTVSIQAMHSFSSRRLYQAQGVEGVKSISPLYISTLPDWKDPETGRSRIMYVMGFEPGQPVLDLPEVNQQLEVLKTPDVFLFDRVSRGDFVTRTAARLEQGESIAIEAAGRRTQLIGLFTLGATPIADGNLITSDLNFLRLFKNRQLGEIDVGLINLEPGTDAQRVLEALQENLPKDVRVLTKQRYVEFEKDYVVNSTPTGAIFNIGVAMGFIIGTVIMYQILYSEVTDHLAEYATLKARGYRDSYLLGVVYQEAIILSVLGYAPGFVMALGFYEFTSKLVKVAIFMTFSSAIQVFVLSVLMCCISGAIASRKLRAADPADIFS